MIDYDEEELIAICDKLPDEQILIAGEYGGNLPDTTNKGERVLIQKTKEYITTITFIPGQSDEIKVYEIMVHTSVDLATMESILLLQ